MGRCGFFLSRGVRGLLLGLFVGSLGLGEARAAVPPTSPARQTKAPQKTTPAPAEDLKSRLQARTKKNTKGSDSLVFDLPVTTNRKVVKWIHYYQTRGRKWFHQWLERSTRYLPFLQNELKQAGLPADLAFIVMIESGFSPQATSTASAVGPWQFIEPTGNRYGLSRNWWLDERRDLVKSTRAAIRYIKELYAEFGSWYLVAASYNMGENGLRRRIRKHGTKDFWTLIQKGALPLETQEYVPKILAAMLIAKAPNLYGFRDVEKQEAFDFETISVPGGTDLDKVADLLGVTRKSLKDLNAELILGYIPRQVDKHTIRVPRGAGRMVADSLQRGRNSWD